MIFGCRAGRRFLVLIIKVTVTELSEASAPSVYNYCNTLSNLHFEVAALQYVLAGVASAKKRADKRVADLSTKAAKAQPPQPTPF